ncbi:hypothetical protein E2C01_026824 [Portunus trituberculatus]|uniref:Uncharacterized protein n=1 Tax=Portunus trituberculatus TaxID=210409 RepID=A0A5B7EKA7_PORTR|nr:hypothetical protein [Portunus trituberculatus]
MPHLSSCPLTPPQAPIPIPMPSYTS